MATNTYKTHCDSLLETRIETLNDKQFHSMDGGVL